jgi:2,3-dihydroxybenzoate decarboxylase
MVAKKTIYEYFKVNIWLTTSRQFSTAVLQFCIDLVGADRIFYSVDYPYECYHDASNWFDNVNLNTRDKLKVGRENAKMLLKFHDYKECNAPYLGYLAICGSAICGSPTARGNIGR